MAISFIPIEHYRTKFYQKEMNSKRFLELTEEQLDKLAEFIAKKQEMIAEPILDNTDKAARLEKYQRILQYLTNPYIHLELRTYDERLAYLIMTADPELVTFKEFLKRNIVGLAEISRAEDETEKVRLRNLRRQNISDYEVAVRNQIGFFDPKLLKYEELFFKRFFSEKELITEVGSNNQDTLMIMAKALPDFNSISDERFEKLVDIAQSWLSLVPEKQNSKVATYSVINQKKLLGLNGLAEQLALFVLLVDSDLDMLRIYEEESMMKNIEGRITDQFGYYNPELLVLERKFHKRFCPEKKLSVWTKTKKD